MSMFSLTVANRFPFDLGRTLRPFVLPRLYSPIELGGRQSRSTSSPAASNIRMMTKVVFVRAKMVALVGISKSVRLSEAKQARTQ